LEGQPQYRIQVTGFGIQDSGKCDDGGCLVSGERIGFRIQDSGFGEVRSWWSLGFWGKGRIQDSGFRIQGRATMVVAWFLGKG
jgi:hypothetical protein